MRLIHLSNQSRELLHAWWDTPTDWFLCLHLNPSHAPNPMTSDQAELFNSYFTLMTIALSCHWKCPLLGFRWYDWMKNMIWKRHSCTVVTDSLLAMFKFRPRKNIQVVYSLIVLSFLKIRICFSSILHLKLSAAILFSLALSFSLSRFSLNTSSFLFLPPQIFLLSSTCAPMPFLSTRWVCCSSSLSGWKVSAAALSPLDAARKIIGLSRFFRTSFVFSGRWKNFHEGTSVHGPWNVLPV